MGSIGFLWLLPDEQVRHLVDRPQDLEGVCYQAYQDADGLLLHLGKTWGALHFLLTGTAYDGVPPLNFILSGGRWIERGVGDTDIRFFRAFTSDLLPEIHSALVSPTRAEVMRRFDGPEMDRLHVGQGRWSERGQEAASRLLDQLDDVRNHVRHGVRRGLGMLAWLE